MKKCNECNTEMRIGKLFGEPFMMDMDHDIDEFYVDVQTGRQTKSLLGVVPEADRVPLLVFVCPQCGKVELNINPQKLTKIDKS